MDDLAIMPLRPLENTRFMRAWTRCFLVRHMAGRPQIETGDFVDYFQKYKLWFLYPSFICPARRIEWKRT